MTQPQRPLAQRVPGIVGLLGIATAAILVPLTQGWEGRVHRAYLDPVKVLTICDGDTASVRRGEVDSDTQCDARLDRQLQAHAVPVLACTPALKGHPYQTAAAIDLAYNIGAPAYCRSTVAVRFNAHQWRAACDGLLAWDMAGGKVLPGLLNRRRAERALCLKELPK